MNIRDTFRELTSGYRVLLNEFRDGIELVDILMISTIPIVVSFVFLLPISIQQGLMLDFQNLGVFDFFSYAFVHRGPNHFTNNMISYMTVTPICYLFCVLAQEKKFFRYNWLIFILVFPAVIGLIELVSPVTPGTSAGFSGVNSAFLGFLAISLTLFLRNRISKQIQVAHAVVLLLLVLGFTSLTYSGLSGLTTGTFAATLLLIIFYTYRTGANEFRKVFVDIASMQGYFEFVLFALIFFLALPIMIFPAEISTPSGTIDIFAHYLGLILGFFLPLVYLTYRNTETDRAFLTTLKS